MKEFRCPTLWDGFQFISKGDTSISLFEEVELHSFILQSPLHAYIISLLVGD